MTVDETILTHTITHKFHLQSKEEELKIEHPLNQSDTGFLDCVRCEGVSFPETKSGGRICKFHSSHVIRFSVSMRTITPGSSTDPECCFRGNFFQVQPRKNPMAEYIFSSLRSSFNPLLFNYRQKRFFQAIFSTSFVS